MYFSLTLLESSQGENPLVTLESTRHVYLEIQKPKTGGAVLDQVA